MLVPGDLSIDQVLGDEEGTGAQMAIASPALQGGCGLQISFLELPSAHTVWPQGYSCRWWAGHWDCFLWSPRTAYNSLWTQPPASAPDRGLLGLSSDYSLPPPGTFCNKEVLPPASHLQLLQLGNWFEEDRE